MNNGHVKSVILQGRIDYSGFWQYLVKNRVDISPYEKKLFSISYADFFSVLGNGQYAYEQFAE